MIAVFVAKTVRTFCYGFLGVILPIYLSELGLGVVEIGVALTLTLAGSAAGSSSSPNSSAPRHSSWPSGSPGASACSTRRYSPT